MLSLILFVLLTIIQNAHIFASYCGEDAIPFSLQALKSGHPVLGCARPSCFGWGVKTDKGARFYRIQKKNDGFLRHTDLKTHEKTKIVAKKSQLAFCEKNYASSSCDENAEWVGGLSPSLNIAEQPLLLKCCKFDNLKNSWDRGIADVGPGQIVVGGEVMQGERQYAFDYIANIKKYFKNNGSIAYSVTVRRFRCLPYPTKSNLYVEGNTLPYIMDKMATNYQWNNQEAANFGQSSPQLGDKMIVNHAASQKLSPELYAEASRVSVPFLPSLPISPVMDSTSTVSFSSANQHYSFVPINTNQQHLDTSAVQPVQLTAIGQETQQIFQQPFTVQQQSGMQTVPEPYKLYSQKSEQPQQQHTQSLLYERQMEPVGPQQPVQPQSSQFPIFPSFNQLAFSAP